jgi:aspartyl protease family protein
MRGFVVLVLAIGFFATLLGQIASQSTSHWASTTPKAAEGTPDDEAQLVTNPKARSAPQFSSQDGSVELQRDEDGHFYADVRINGAEVHMLVDTGASGIALSRDDARTAGIATSIGMNDVVGKGADGAIHGEYVKLDRVELGPLSAEGLNAIVLNSGEQSLLGQSFLSKFSSVQIEGNRMMLR